MPAGDWNLARTLGHLFGGALADELNALPAFTLTTCPDCRRLYNVLDMHWCGPTPYPTRVPPPDFVPAMEASR